MTRIMRFLAAIIVVVTAGCALPIASAAPPSVQCLAAFSGSTANSVALDWNDVDWAVGSTSRRYEVHEDLFNSRDNLVTTVTASNRTSGALAAGNYRYFVIAKDSTGASTIGPKVTVKVPVLGTVRNPAGCDPNAIPTTTTTPPTTTTTPSTTTTTTTPTTTTTTTPPPVNTRFFNGDYSTGNFSQWPWISTKLWNDPNNGGNKTTVGYPDGYPASIVGDSVKGTAARFEVRTNEGPYSTQSQVTATVPQTGTGSEGQTRWYAMSMKFDANFPQNHASLGWGLVAQFHDGENASYSPSVAWYVDQVNGQLSLTITRQPSPGQYQAQFPIFNVPLGTDWHDFKMRIVWSRSDSVGSIQLWHNGVRQTLLQGPYGTLTDGGTTYLHRTLHPSSNSVYYKEGYYRNPNISVTGIVYHAGFRSASDEAGL